MSDLRDPKPTKIEFYIDDKPKRTVSDRLVVNSYLIYAMFWQTLVCAGGVGLIYAMGWSWWWTVALIYLSSTQIAPAKWRELVHKNG